MQRIAEFTYRMWVTVCLVAVSLSLASQIASGFPNNFVNETVLSGVGRTLSIDFLPDGRMLTGQKNGKIRISDPSQSLPLGFDIYMQITDINSNDERGLLELEVDPDFANNGYFYVIYNHGTSNRLRVSRFQHQENSGALTSRGQLGSETVLWQDPDQALNCCHQAGGLDFGPDGKLYIVLGDQFDNSRGQDLTKAGGKILRINKDGSIPADNPDLSALDANALPEIWAYGLRNPFRAHWDLVGGRYYITEVGGNVQASATEDLHIGRKGANYGWPNCEGYNCNPASPPDPAPFNVYDQPLFSYDHAGDGAAIIGGVVYRGNQFPAAYQGAYFFADYPRDFIHYLTFDNNGAVAGEVDFESKDSNPGSNAANAVAVIEEGPDGALYYGQLNNAETVKRVRYVGGGNQPPIITQANATPNSGPVPLQVSFSGVATDGENDSLTYNWVFGDGNQANGSSVNHTYLNAGNYTAFLQVSDGTNNPTVSSPIDINVGVPPQANILTPTNGATFRAGNTVNFSAMATDQDGVLNESSYSWNVLFWHNEHFHTGPTFSGSTGDLYIETSGHDWNDSTYYELILTVTDSDGLTDVQSVFIYPEKVDLTFDTSPTGLTLLLDGIPRITPYTYDTLIDFQHVVDINSPVCIGQVEYGFTGWSDSGAKSHTIVVPDSNASYTAVFSPTGASCNSVPSTGLVLHLESDQGLNISGGNVVSWNDLSGMGNSLSAAGNPVILNGAANGQNAIHFDGIDDKLEKIGLSGMPAGNSDRTMFMLARYNGAVANTGFNYGNTNCNEGIGLTVKGNGKLRVSNWLGGTGTGCAHLNSQEAGTGTGWLLQEMVLGAGTVTHYLNGSPIATSSQSYNTVPNQIVVGANLSSAKFNDMDVAAILVYDTALSTSQRQQVENYLTAKYMMTPPPTITVSSPGDGEQVAGPDLTINYQITGQGYDHAHFTIDSEPHNTDMGLTGTYTIANVAPGSHTLTAQLVDPSHTPLTNPEAMFTVNFTMLGNQPPIANPDPGLSVTENTPAILNVLGNDTDADGSLVPGSVQIEVAALKGTATANPDGTVTYTPNPGATGADSFEYTVADDDGDRSNQALVGINIVSAPANAPPVATDDTGILVLQDTPLLIDVLANDSDSDGSLVVSTVQIVSPAAIGQAVANADGTVTYTPNPGVTGLDSFTYTVDDNGGATSNAATVSLSIDPSVVSGPPVTTGLVLHLETDSGVATNGGQVSGWSDQSGNGNSPTGIGEPVLLSGAAAGQDAIHFDGVNDRLELKALTGMPTGNGNRSIFFVVRYNNSVANTGFNYGNPNCNEGIGLTVKGNGMLRVSGWLGGGTVGECVHITSTELGEGSGWLLQGLVLESSDARLYRDGALISSQTHVYNTIPAQLMIGSNLNAAKHGDIDVAALLVYNQALSDTQRQQVEQYLRTKYGLP